MASTAKACAGAATEAAELSLSVSDMMFVALHRSRLNILREEQQTLLRQRDKTSKARKDRLAAIKSEIELCVTWNYTTKDEVLCAIAAADTLYLGYADRIERRSISKGTELRTLRSPGAVVAMAAGGEQLIATTRRGRVLCFGAGQNSVATGATTRAPAGLPKPSGKTSVDRWVGDLDSPRGFAILLEPPDLQVVSELLTGSELHLLIVQRDR